MAAIAAAVAAGATLVAAAAAITALVFARRAARAAGDQVSQAREQVSAAQAQVTAAQEQTRQAGELEWQRTRANVVVYMEPNPAVHYIADLVIANFGATPARDVALSADTPLRRTAIGGDPQREMVAPAQPIPLLAPGQQWRTSWDQAWKYMESPLPRRYKVTVAFTDERGEQRESDSVLDWTSFVDRRYMTHDEYRTLVMPLTEIAGGLKELSEIAWGGQKPEETLIGDAYDEHGRRLSDEEVQSRWARATGRLRAALARHQQGS